MKNWLNLQSWAALHGISPRTATNLIFNGKIASTDYIHEGKLWRIKPDAAILNKPVLNLPPCKNFLKELEAI